MKCIFAQKDGDTNPFAAGVASTSHPIKSYIKSASAKGDFVFAVSLL
jgi:hypothetical protein